MSEVIVNQLPNDEDSISVERAVHFLRKKNILEPISLINNLNEFQKQKLQRLIDGDIKRDDICFASEFEKFLERVPAWNTNQNKNPIQNENLIQNDLSGHKRDRNKQERGREDLRDLFNLKSNNLLIIFV